MAKSYLPLAVLAGTLVLGTGCGGNDSVASKSARAFSAAQQRGESFGGDGHAHGHGAASPAGGEAGKPSGHEGHDGSASPAEESVGGVDHAAMGHGVDQGAGTGDSHSAMEHGAMQHDASDSKQGRGSAMDHAAMGHSGHTGAATAGAVGEHGSMAHGEQGQAPMDHAAMGHANAQPGGAAASDHAAMGHGSQQQPGAAQPDHAAMGHGTPAGSSSAPSLGTIEAATHRAPASPVAPGAPAATLAPDPLDAPARTSVEEAERSAAMAREMSGGGEHGGHGGAGTYRQLDAGREPASQPTPREAAPGDHSGHSGHEPVDTPTPPGRAGQGAGEGRGE